MDASEQQSGGYAGPWAGQHSSYPSVPRAEHGAYHDPAAGQPPSTPMRAVASGRYPDAYVVPAARRGRFGPSGSVTGGMFDRAGLLGWWLRLTAPAWPDALPAIGERERLRKAELTGLSILAVALLLATLLSANLDRPQTAISALVAGAGLVVAAMLNRAGWTRTAAYLVPTILMLVVIGGIVWEDGGLQLMTVPAYDLFVLPIFLTSLIGDRRAPWAFATIAMAFILCDVLLQPHALITSGTVTAFDDVQYAMNVRGWWGLVSGPLALAFFAALFGWLGALSVETAITRADRAEEIAALEHLAAQQRRQLEHGVRQILQTHVRVANGDFTARAPLGHDNVLWQIGSSLNNLIARMQRNAQAEQALARTEAELRRVAAALDEAEAGGQPRWPSPSGTAADLVLVRVAQHTARGPHTPILSFASDAQSQPSPESAYEAGHDAAAAPSAVPAHNLAVGWRASSLIDPDALLFGRTAGPAETRRETRPIKTTTQAPGPRPNAVPPVAAPATSAGPALSTPPRAPNTQPGAARPQAARASTAKLSAAQGSSAGLAPAAAARQAPLQAPRQASSGAPAPAAPSASGGASAQPFDPDAWLAWLAGSGARLVGNPELAEAGEQLTQGVQSRKQSEGTDGRLASATGPVAAVPPGGAAPQASPAPQLFATAMPDQALADAAANVPWHSETRRRRAQFLGPAPNPPWMEPEGA